MNRISPAAQRLAVIGETRRQGAAKRVWEALRLDANRMVVREPLLHRFVERTVLVHDDFGSGLAALLAGKLADRDLPEAGLEDLARAAFVDDPLITASAIDDFAAILSRDPAADSFLSPFLYYKGFQALQWQRVGHWLWQQDRRGLARFLQSRVSEVFAVDIHPAVPIGHGVFIDHATGLVVGETAVIGDDVSILQNVTLGGTGKEHGDRHPKIREGVLIAAGAKVLGNIEIGRRSKIGAGSVVLHDVPARATVAGVPARIVGWCKDATECPAKSMDQSLPEPDFAI